MPLTSPPMRSVPSVAEEQQRGALVALTAAPPRVAARPTRLPTETSMLHVMMTMGCVTKISCGVGRRCAPPCPLNKLVDREMIRK